MTGAISVTRLNGVTLRLRYLRYPVCQGKSGDRIIHRLCRRFTVWFMEVGRYGLRLEHMFKNNSVDCRELSAQEPCKGSQDGAGTMT